MWYCHNLLLSKNLIRLTSIFFYLFLNLLLSFSLAAKDIIKVNRNQADDDKRMVYLYDVLDTALTMSVDKYGAYEIIIAKDFLPKHRGLDAVVEGELLNVLIVTTSIEKEKRAIPIRIPLRMGALAFRLLLIDENKLTKFTNIKTLEQLKNLHVGVDRNWVTTDILQHLNFKLANVGSYDTLFEMLTKSRFDYLPRGVHEIYQELVMRKPQLPSLMIQPTLALCIPLPYYMFVSPKYPKLAQRLTYGLEKMVQTGTLRKMFYQYYGATLAQADLKNRTIIHVGNPLLPKIPLDRKELWIEEVQLCQ